MVSRPLEAVGDTFPMTGMSKKPQLWHGDPFRTTFQKSWVPEKGPLESGESFFKYLKSSSLFSFQVPILKHWGCKFYKPLIPTPLSHQGSLQLWRWVGHGLAAFSCYPGTSWGIRRSMILTTIFIFICMNMCMYYIDVSDIPDIPR